MLSVVRHTAQKILTPAVEQGVKVAGSNISRISAQRLSLVSSQSSQSLRPLADFNPMSAQTQGFSKLLPAEGGGSSAASSGRAERVTESVRQACADYKNDKPPVNVAFKLHDGSAGVVRRPTQDDVPAIYRFLHDKPMYFGHQFSTEANTVAVISDMLFDAGAANSDTVVAVVGGKVIGAASHDDCAPSYEPQLDQGLVRSLGMPTPAAVCLSMKVTPEYEGQGVGFALKKAQVESARAQGYGSIAGYTSNESVRSIGGKLGGVSDGSMTGWSIVPCEPIVKKGG
ncbi:MAG TPA: GNAT family N-acetyltransferase [Ramlibacter sp.]|nr:GNAT family N-acetyltransferase [Ramlibacter sp.]